MPQVMLAAGSCCAAMLQLSDWLSELHIKLYACHPFDGHSSLSCAVDGSECCRSGVGAGAAQCQNLVPERPSNSKQYLRQRKSIVTMLHPALEGFAEVCGFGGRMVWS